MKHGPWPGTWKCVCDVCGFQFASDAVKKRWDGLITCTQDWEPKHPQLSIRGVTEKMVPAFVRPESTDVFINVCTLWGSSPYADLAAADCATVGNTGLTYQYLLQLKADSERTF